jgi:hypothetical protein
MGLRADKKMTRLRYNGRHGRAPRCIVCQQRHWSTQPCPAIPDWGRGQVADVITEEPPMTRAGYTNVVPFCRGGLNRRGKGVGVDYPPLFREGSAVRRDPTD